MSAYADGVIMSDISDIEVISTTLTGYVAVTGPTINQKKPGEPAVRGTWRGKPMLLDSVVSRWTDVPVKMLGVWFGPDLQWTRPGVM